MSNLPSPGWQRLDGGDGGTRYVLPPRPLNVTRLVQGCQNLAVALVATGVGATAVVWIVLHLLEDFNALCAFWLLITVSITIFSLSMLQYCLTDLPFARLAIEVRTNRLCAIRRLGWIRRTRCCRLESMRALQIEGTELNRVIPFTQSILVHRLSAAGVDGPLVLAEGYPLLWLEELGNDLRQHMRVAESSTGELRRLAELPLEIRPDQVGAAPHLQPSISQARLRWSDNELSLTVPPIGFLRDPTGFQWVSLIAGTLSLVFTLGVLENGILQPWSALPLFLYLVTFVVVRTWLRTTQSVTSITIGPNGLHLHRRHFRDYDDRRWSLTEIEEVTIGKSSLPVNKGHPQHPQLEIRLRQARSVGLLAGYPREELQWVAHVLQEGLARQPKPPEPGLAEILAKVPGGRITARHIGKQLVLHCPALGVPFKMVTFLLFGMAILTGTGFGIRALIQMGFPADVHFVLVIGYWLLAGFGLFLGLGIPIEAFTDAGRTRDFHIEPDRLRIHETTIWGERERVWQRSELKYIDVGPLLSIGSEVIPVAGLQFTLHTKGQTRLGQWHTIEEMLWLARVLRFVLDLPAPPSI